MSPTSRPGDAVAVAAAVALAVAVSDVLVGYAHPGASGLAFHRHLSTVPAVLVLVFALTLLAWLPLRFMASLTAHQQRAAQLALAVAALAAFWALAALRYTGKPLRIEPATLIAAAVGAAVGLPAFRLFAGSAREVTLHPRNLLLPSALGSIALACIATARALDRTPGGGLFSVALLIGLTALALRALPTRQMPSQRLRRLPLLLGILLLASAASLTVGEPGRVVERPADAAAPADAPRHVVLITVDTLRADAVGPQDGAESLTPNLDAFAATSVSFPLAYSRAPWTMPSVASILTGVSPIVHGVVRSDTALPLELETLAEAMARRGYRTAAFGWNPYLNESFGFDQGFDEFFVVPRPSTPEAPIGWVIRKLTDPRALTTELPADALNALALEWSEANRAGPFFLWLHYFDPHAPYASHPEYMGDRTPPDGFRPGLDWRVGDALLRGIRGRRRAEREWVKALYDAEVRFFDRELGRMFAGLRALGVYDDALIVLTADHGQEFWEHGQWGHGQSLYQEQIRVPLYVKLPGQTQARVHAAPVINESLAPTLFSLCRIEYDPERFTSPALPLRSSGSAASSSASPPIVATATHTFDLSTAIVSGGFKYIRSWEAGREQLYDLARDPGERHDEAYRQPERVAALRSGLDELRAHAAELRRRYGLADNEQPDLEAGTLENLRALGYVR